MKALVISPIVYKGKVAKAGETIEMTKEEFDSVKAHVAEVIEKAPEKVVEKVETKVVEKAKAIEKKVVKKQKRS